MTMFSMAGDAPDRTLSVFYADGDTATIPESHDRFEDLIDLLLSGAGDEPVRDLVDIMFAAKKKLSILSERITYTPHHILFDGDPIHGELVEAIREAFEADNLDALRPIVNFLEKVSTNPALESIDALYRWISNGELTIHEDGDFLAYKGVNRDSEGNAVSVSSGTAFVNGVEHKGNIPNAIGSVITMPRSVVDARGFVGCSVGLHAGKSSYAFDFGSGGTILVKINPRDVVSVPTDCGSQKLRVCRYVVLREIESVLDFRVYREVSPVEDTAPQVDDEEYFEDFADDVVDLEEQEPEKTPPTQEDVVKAVNDSVSQSLKDGRDRLGRFTKESVSKAVRDAKGRFIGKKN